MLYAKSLKHLSLVLSFFLILSFSFTSYADGWCFAFAKTYFEQVYCEVKAKGKGQGLPSIYEFRKNPDNIQALLLKRPAASIGIDYAIPKKITRVKKTVAKRTIQPAITPSATRITLPKCSLTGKILSCDGLRYELVGNKANKHLSKGALSDSNAMGLTNYSGNLMDATAINNYLYRSYLLYIEKMLAIGLGGVTMSYGQFAFLFDDLQERQVSFSDRFETMYTFLKKDKASIAVDESVSANKHLKIEDCHQLNDRLIVCYKNSKNYIFRAKVF